MSKYACISICHVCRMVCLSAGLLFMACTEQKPASQQKVESFPVEKSLFAERVKVNEVFSLSKMMCKGDYLFVSDARSNENLIHQYSLPDFKCVYEGDSRYFLYFVTRRRIKCIFGVTQCFPSEASLWTMQANSLSRENMICLYLAICTMIYMS